MSNYFVLSPDCPDDCRGESVCTKKKDRKAGEETCKHFPVCGLIEGKNSGEIGEGDEVFKKNVDKGAFTPLGSMILDWS